MSETNVEDPVATLSAAEALPLVRRAAGARGITWPADRQAVSGVGGLTLDLTHHPGQETVAWATLNKQDGIMGLFSAEGKLLDTGNQSLARIQRVQPVTLPGVAQYGLMVDDLDDEMVGAFFREERRHIYVWDGRSLRELFKASLLAEQFRHLRWENKKAPAAWRIRREQGDVRLEGGILKQMITRQELEAPGATQDPIPPPEKFKVLSEQREEKRYRWNPRLRRFEPLGAGGGSGHEPA